LNKFKQRFQQIHPISIKFQQISALYLLAEEAGAGRSLCWSRSRKNSEQAVAVDEAGASRSWSRQQQKNSEA
jgi:hypothetical protein